MMEDKSPQSLKIVNLGISTVSRRWPYIPGLLAFYYIFEYQLIQITLLQLIVIFICYAILIEAYLISQNLKKIRDQIDKLDANLFEQAADVSERYFATILESTQIISNSLELIQKSDLILKKDTKYSYDRGRRINDIAVQKLYRAKTLMQKLINQDEIQHLDLYPKKLDKRKYNDIIESIEGRLINRVLSWTPTSHDSFLLIDTFRESWSECKTDGSISHNLQKAIYKIDQIIEIRKNRDTPETRNSPSKTVILGAAVNGIIAFTAASICGLKFNCSYSYFIMPFYAMSQGIIMAFDAILSDDNDSGNSN
ncbi:MAG: hypothetical protein V2B19_32585 [Pseudomonadota bacterium]